MGDNLTAGAITLCLSLLHGASNALDVVVEFLGDCVASCANFIDNRIGRRRHGSTPLQVPPV
ncbi:MAG TPA: hypothetical protein VLX28_08185, partial [Thermoanaerobaculia bacterium]|nr:hypothetical protein [Thermoanaerobaculia bacterium]